MECRYRKYKFNELYFDNIDTANKAYFLGFLFADGCNAGNSIKIQVSEIDKDILYKFKKEILGNQKILYCKPNTIKNLDKIYTSRPSYVLWINSKIVCSKLDALGCVPRKTFLLRFPKRNIIPKKFYSHFIRGYFDGDGSLAFETYKKGCKLNLIGRKDFCLKIKKILESELKITLSFNKYNPQKYWTLYSSSIPTVKKILDFLYKDSKIHINRKYKKYIKFIKIKYIPYVNKNYKKSNKIYLKKFLGEYHAE